MVNERRWLVALLLACWLMPAMAEARQDQAAIVIDANTGTVLHAADADGTRYPASLTKMMTIYLVFEELRAGRLEMATPIRLSDNAAGQPPSALGLEAGDTITIEDALGALITKSANDVAVAVAEHIGGSESQFARRMTAKARALGMQNTTFRNASGLPDDEQVTTARDMATLGLALQDTFPARYRMFGQSRFTYNSKRYRNHNRLLGRFRGADGIKTGYTRASGFNIATSVRRDGKHLVGVVLGYRSGRDRDRAMRSLLTASLTRAAARRTRPRRGRPVLIARPRLVPEPAARPQGTPVVQPTVARAHQSPSQPVAAAVVPRGSETLKRTVRQPSTLGGQAARLAAAIPPAAVVIPKTAPQPAPAATSHQIQVGAFFSEAEARQALVTVQSLAGTILAGYQPISIKLPSVPRPVFRARFAGFDGRGAAETCARLKTLRVDCFVARSN